MAGSSVSGRKPEVLAFIDQVSDLIRADDYEGAAAAIAQFAKAHHSLLFFVQEALPSRVSDHLLTKTGAHSAFTTYTLRNPNWATELTNAATNPEAFAGLIKAIEAALLASKSPKAA